MQKIAWSKGETAATEVARERIRAVESRVCWLKIRTLVGVAFLVLLAIGGQESKREGGRKEGREGYLLVDSCRKPFTRYRKRLDGMRPIDAPLHIPLHLHLAPPRPHHLLQPLPKPLRQHFSLHRRPQTL